MTRRSSHVTIASQFAEALKEPPTGVLASFAWVAMSTPSALLALRPTRPLLSDQHVAGLWSALTRLHTKRINLTAVMRFHDELLDV